MLTDFDQKCQRFSFLLKTFVNEIFYVFFRSVKDSQLVFSSAKGCFPNNVWLAEGFDFSGSWGGVNLTKGALAWQGIRKKCNEEERRLFRSSGGSETWKVRPMF